jgi:hypothetical protein
VRAASGSIPAREPEYSFDRAREYVAGIEADRVDSRDEGGAYSSGGSGGYGSMMRTSWREDVPKPVTQHQWVTPVRSAHL